VPWCGASSSWPPPPSVDDSIICRFHNQRLHTYTARIAAQPTTARDIHNSPRDSPMRPASFASLVRTCRPAPRVIVRRSMPIPFLGALFGSSAAMADKANYPVQKTEGEWQAQLSPGRLWRTRGRRRLTFLQSSSASSARKAQKHPVPASTTSTIPKKASTRVPPARPRCTRPTTNSTRAAAGLPSGTLSLMPWASAPTPPSA